MAVWVAIVLVVAAPGTWAASPSQWKSRTIYQIVTDRFALSSPISLQSDHAALQSNTVAARDPPIPSCALQETYCGGTFQGIIDQLDYIQGMGFDAIWISPVVANFPNSYHGYGAQDLYTVS